jgi:hypothetical protein
MDRWIDGKINGLQKYRSRKITFVIVCLPCFEPLKTQFEPTFDKIPNLPIQNCAVFAIFT